MLQSLTPKTVGVQSFSQIAIISLVLLLQMK